jgi:hypothetical protein
VYWTCTPFAYDAFAGDTSIEVIVIPATVTVELSVKPPEAHEIDAVPTATALARPWLPAAFDTETFVASVVSQNAVAVRSCVELSLYTPVQVNCSVVPVTIVGLTGVTTTLVRTTPVTVSVVDPLMPLRLAVIVVVPAPVAVARPFDPSVFEIVATLGALELHDT